VLAQAIAREMKFTKWQQQGVRVAALLHDIGKIGVPSEILSKPGQLTEYEYNIVKTHCATSVELLGNIEFPWPVIDAVSQHHERLDGSGYPDGLSGDDVILEARILAVADVVEAMSSHRPYRPALGLERALEEVSRGRGLKYDKDTVDACLKVCREQQHDFEQLLDTVDSNRTPVTAGVQV